MSRNPQGEPRTAEEQRHADLRTIRRSLPVIVGPETAELWLAFGRIERDLGHGIYAEAEAAAPVAGLREVAARLDRKLYGQMWGDIYREYPYEAEAMALHRALGCDQTDLHPPHDHAAAALRAIESPAHPETAE